MLAVEGVAAGYDGVPVLRGVSLRIEAGETVAVLGANGAGKTTLFALVSGFERPDEGFVGFRGERISGLAPEAVCVKGIVRTFQITQPFAGLSVRENIAVGAHLHLRKRRAALDAATEICTEVALATQLDKPAHALTVAGRKRLEVARALATRPKLLLLDEGRVIFTGAPEEAFKQKDVVEAYLGTEDD